MGCSASFNCSFGKKSLTGDAEVLLGGFPVYVKKNRPRPNISCFGGIRWHRGWPRCRRACRIVDDGGSERIYMVRPSEEQDFNSDRIVTTRRRAATLCITASVFVAVVFAPTGRWGWQAIWRKHPVRVGDLETEIPRAWMISKKGFRLEAWRPCLTLFCQVPSASMSFSWMGRRTCDREIVMHSSGVTFEQIGFTDRRADEVHVDGESLDCLEATKAGRSDFALSACFKASSCILGTFEGPNYDLGTFHRITARARYNSPPHTSPGQ